MRFETYGRGHERLSLPPKSKSNMNVPGEKKKCDGKLRLRDRGEKMESSRKHIVLAEADFANRTLL